MRTRLVPAVLVAVVALGGCAFLTRSSVGPPPTTAQANGPSSAPSVSAGGHFTAFLSAATNLVADDTNGVVDVFVRDNFAGTTTRVSATGTGSQLTASSADPSISDDGRYVAFVTRASLVAADTNTFGDVYVKDRTTGAVVWASVRSDPSFTDVTDCLGDEISGDGHRVAFHCNQTFPVGEGGSVSRPVGPWVRDVRFGSTSGPYVQPPPFGLPSLVDYDLSGDGSVVVFTWSSSTLQSTETLVGVGDTDIGITTNQFDLAGSSVAVSGDGRTYAVQTETSVNVASTSAPDRFTATLPGPTTTDLALSADGTLLGATVAIGGVQVTARRTTDGSDDWVVTSRTAHGDRVVAVHDGAMSTDGQWFTFTSTDPGLVPDDTNALADVFTRSVFSAI